MSGDLDDIFTNISVTCDDNTYVAASECVKHRKGLHATVTFILDGRGVKIITST